MVTDHRIEYRRFERPIRIGGGRVIYGAYAVILVDGFIYLSPHAALPGTTSELPIDLPRNPEFVNLLVQSAKELRALRIASADPG